MTPVEAAGARGRAAGAALAAALALSAACGDVADGGPGAEDRGSGAAAAGDGAEGPVVRPLSVRAPRPHATDSALATLRRGVRLLEEGRPRAADDSLGAAAGALPPARDWIRLSRARAAADLGDTARVRRLLAGPNPLPSARWARSIRVVARDSAGDPLGAARTALAGTREEVGEETRSRAWLLAARLFARADSQDRARDALGRAAETGPGRDPGLEAAEELVDRGDLSAEEELLVGRVLAAHGLWWRAHPHFRRHLAATGRSGDGRASGRREQVRLDHGRALLYAGRYPGAIEVLSDLGRADDPDVAAPAALLEGRARLWHRDEADGVERLRQLVRRFPERPEAGEALSELASRAGEEGRPAEARRYWIRAARHAGSAEQAELRLARGAALAYMAGNYDSAAALFAGRGREAAGEEARLRSLYWSGLAERAAGRSDRSRSLLEAAITVDRLSYYGSSAAALLGRPLLPADLPPGPWTPEDLERELTNAVLRLRVAEALPLEGAVGEEAERLEAHFARHEDGLYALSEAMSDAGFPLQGVRVAARIRSEEDGLDLRLLRLRYPFPHREEIRRAARSRDLSPYLVAGLVRQESLFEADIESYAGAIGLMQIMPRTGRELAREHGVGGFRAADLRRPSLNLRLGTGYLRELIDRFDGRLAFALAAYNAGPHRVARWRRRPYAADVDVFMEGIPFRQTRRYVKTVQANARVYAALYGCGRYEPCLGREASFALRAVARPFSRSDSSPRLQGP